MENYVFLNIDEKTNLDEIIDLYKKAIMRQYDFKYTYINDRLVVLYYKFCVNDDLSVDDFLNNFNIENKDEFLTKANKIIDESKNQYLEQLEKSLDLKVAFNFKEFSELNKNKIIDAINILTENVKSKLSYSFTMPEKGFTKSDLENLLDIEDYIKKDLEIKEYYNGSNEDSTVSLNRTIQAYSKMDNLIDEINSLNLSPFEKFLYVHDYVANRIYKKEEFDAFGRNGEESRSFVNAMTRDTIVCAGYANIMKVILTRLGIECMYISGGSQERNEQGFSVGEYDGHAANVVHIKDDKYNIDGYYFCDACWDSKQDINQKNKNYFYSALPIQDVKGIGQSVYFNNVIKSMDIPKESKPILINSYRKALNIIYKDKNQVENDLQDTVQFAYNACNIGSKNDFMQEYYRQREQTLNN